MTAAEDLADVNNTLNFMNQNIVICELTGDNTVLLTNGFAQYTLVQRQANKARGHMRGSPNAPVRVFYLNPVPVPAWRTSQGERVDPNPFDAYFCPYQGGETHGTVISGGANLMFTTQMDGCSLGIGSTTPGGDRLIFHANRGGTSQVASAAQDQSLRQEFRNLYTHIDKVWAPKDYRVSAGGTFYKSTTFGVRDAHNTWRFYSQRYTIEAIAPVTVYSLKEVAVVL